MTVTVSLADGGTDKYMRFGDSYLERKDGTLCVRRGGTKHVYRYPSGAWTHVDGNHKRSNLARLLALIAIRPSSVD